MVKLERRIRKRCYCVNCGRMHMRSIGGRLWGNPCETCGAEVKPTARALGGTPPTGRDYAVHIRMRLATVKALRRISAKRVPWKRSSLAGTLNALAEYALEQAGKKVK